MTDVKPLTATELVDIKRVNDFEHSNHVRSSPRLRGCDLDDHITVRRLIATIEAMTKAEGDDNG